MINVEKTVNQITEKDVINVIGTKQNVEFDEMLIESYEFEYDKNDNCVLHSAKIVIPVYAKDNYSESVRFNLNLDGATTPESEIDDKLHELLTAKIDEKIMQ